MLNYFTIVISDNGTRNSVNHYAFPTYHSSSNSQAEKYLDISTRTLKYYSQNVGKTHLSDRAHSKLSYLWEESMTLLFKKGDGKHGKEMTELPEWNNYVNC